MGRMVPGDGNRMGVYLGDSMERTRNEELLHVASTSP